MQQDLPLQDVCMHRFVDWIPQYRMPKTGSPLLKSLTEILAIGNSSCLMFWANRNGPGDGAALWSRVDARTLQITSGRRRPRAMAAADGGSDPCGPRVTVARGACCGSRRRTGADVHAVAIERVGATGCSRHVAVARDDVRGAARDQADGAHCSAVLIRCVWAVRRWRAHGSRSRGRRVPAAAK